MQVPLDHIARSYQEERKERRTRAKRTLLCQRIIVVAIRSIAATLIRLQTLRMQCKIRRTTLQGKTQEKKAPITRRSSSAFAPGMTVTLSILL
jgi:hypothetical protein